MMVLLNTVDMIVVGQRLGEAGTSAVSIGGHKMSADAKMQFSGYFNDVLFGSTCENKGCEYSGIDAAKTISAMFTWKGYSYSEFADVNGAYSITQCFYANKKSIDKYIKATGNEFTFGVLATGNAGNSAIAPVLGADKVVSKELDKLAHDYFEIKVSGITSERMASKIVFCAYVIDGGNMFYLDGVNVGTAEKPVYNGATKTETTGVSYNDLIA